MRSAIVTLGRLRRDAPSRARVVLRRAIEASNRFPPFRAGAALVVALLIRASFVVLRSGRGVRSVFLRGSHGRGDAEPLSSDVDVAILLREDGRPPTLAATREVLRRLRWARRLNPLLRDEWQLVVGEADWPLLARHSTLVGLDEWRDEHGRKPDYEARPAVERLRLAAAWNRQHLWTRESLQRALSPGGRSAADALRFAAAEKKALTYAGRILGGDPPRRRKPPPRTDDAWAARSAELLVRLEESAAVVGRRLEVSPPSERSDDPFPVAPSAAALLDALAKSVDTARFDRILLHAGSVVFVAAEPLELGATVALVRDLAGAAAQLNRPWLFYPPAAFSLAPLVDEVFVVAPTSATAGFLPGLLREQLFYEALFHGAELRVLADRPPPRRGFTYLVTKLARAIVLFRTERLVRGSEAAVARAAEGDEELSACIDRPPVTREEHFHLAALLWSRLREALAEESKRWQPDG